MERTIIQLITQADNEYLTRMTQTEETKNAVQNMDDNFTPGPDSYEGFFPRLLGYCMDLSDQSSESIL